MPTFIYHGHACFELEGKAGRVIIDPFLTGNRLADIRPDQLLKVDAVLLTHGHGDHVGDGLDIARRHGALVVARTSWRSSAGTAAARCTRCTSAGPPTSPSGRAS